MEAFYQESGRAGRDQLPSRSVLYYGMDDRKKMEFILKNASSKKSQSSGSSAGQLEKPLTDFSQMVEYCESSGCRRKKILENFGEVVSASFCRKSCDVCKSPNAVAANLSEVKIVHSKKCRLPPIFTKSSSDATFVGGDSEFWNRDDEGSSPDDDISDSDDDTEVMCNLVKSKMPTKSGLHDNYKVLKRAEEIYYQKEDQRKQSSSAVGRMVVTESLREAGQKRLLSALKQAHERLGDLLPDSDASATFLETECFKKYGKVGKTFYNSQLAATVRWISSASREQIKERLGAIATPAADHCSTSSPAKDTASPHRDPREEKQTREEISNGDIGGNALSEEVGEPVEVTTAVEKLELPPIPSFSEFVNKKGNSLLRSQHSSGGVQKRKSDPDRHRTPHPEKRMKH